MTGIRLNLVEFGHAGHQAEYLRHLVGAWPVHREAGTSLRVTVTPEFAEAHGDLARLAAERREQGVELHVLSGLTADRLSKAARPDRVPVTWLAGDGPPADNFARLAWEVAQRSAVEFGADQLVFMEIDPLLPAVAAHLAAACRFSGLWFAPPRGDHPPSERRWVLHQGVLLRRALSHPGLHRLLCLDAEATAVLRDRTGADALVHLPDPVVLPPAIGEADRARIRGRFGIPDGNRALLFFGQLAARKGLPELVRAVEALAPRFLTRLSLLVAGPALDLDPGDLQERFEKLRQRGVHLRFWPDFVGEELADDLFRACDAVLAVYRNHVGMSGVMLRAAAHGRPVVAQSYGLMGQLCRQHRLGLTVDADAAAALAEALVTAIEGRLGPHFSSVAAAAFAEQHSVEAFCRAFYSATGLSNPSRAAVACQSSQA